MSYDFRHGNTVCQWHDKRQSPTPEAGHHWAPGAIAPFASPATKSDNARDSTQLREPMKLAIAIATLILMAIILPVFFMPAPEDLAARQHQLPWVIEVQPDGNTRALGLTLNVSTLADAKSTYGPDMDVAIVNEPNEPATLEAYVSNTKAGFITGKAVFLARADAQMIEAMRERATKTEYMESTTRKATLSPADLDTAMSLPIQAISFVPSVNLDRQAIVERFGEPGQSVQANDHQTHLLYPDRGLDIILDTEGKELIQYVAPRDFDTLIAPLQAPSPAQ